MVETPDSSAPRTPDDLSGMLLIAMPGMSDPRFFHSVIYLCAYSSEGAMGIIVNKVAADVRFAEIVAELGIDVAGEASGLDVHIGGPVETSRGFVLHSSDFTHPDTMPIVDGVALSATIDVLKAIAGGSGPARRVFALGYAGWGPGQLDQEIQASGWLLAPADDELIFDADNGAKWSKALGRIGVDPSLLSGDVGHA